MSRFRLRSCVWEITLACCFSCAYCGSKAGRARENELTTEECLSVADQLAALGCRRVSMIGGEVFMRPDWDKIIARLTSRGVRVAVITNGFLFKDEHIARLKAVNIESVAVSIDGPERVHDKYRSEGSFKRALCAIDTLIANGIPASVITTLNSENAPLLEELYEVLKSKRIFAWQIQACSPMGNAKEGVDHRFDVKRVIDFVVSHMYDAPFAMGTADNIGYFTEHEGHLWGTCAAVNRCMTSISSKGTCAKRRLPQYGRTRTPSLTTAGSKRSFSPAPAPPAQRAIAAPEAAAHTITSCTESFMNPPPA